MLADRDTLVRDDTTRGIEWCERYSNATDRWLASLMHTAVASSHHDVALVALGGYGRRELCPHSDLDVMLVHRGGRAVDDLASQIWYPIWDADVKLGHSVATVKEATGVASDDLDTATALLDARVIAGDAALGEELLETARREWRRRAASWLEQLAARVVARHEAVGEVAFLLEPDLKEGRGGLRDVQSLRWGSLADADAVAPVNDAVGRGYETLLAARVELHRHTGRASNVLTLQDQDTVAAALGMGDADVLMRDVARAARLIAWRSDDAWRRVRARTRGRLARLTHRDRAIAPGVVLRDGEVIVDAAALDGPALLRVARLAAEHDAVVAHESLRAVDLECLTIAEPWPDGARTDFVGLLATGAPAIAVIEDLDHHGVWARWLPEWDAVRSRPQRNAYHRFTVDRHLLETVRHAAALTPRVDRRDLLLLGALLHDIGKGDTGDHVESGIVIARAVMTRLGYDQSDRARVEALVEHHLLLSEVATRRDLDDPATARWVANRVPSSNALHLLAALTEADSLATGSAAWGPAKAALVRELVERVDHLLTGTTTAPHARPEAFPTAAQLAALQGTDTVINAQGDTLTVMTDDRPGTFSRVAGVLAVHGLDVASALAYSSEDGRALSQFKVVSRHRAEPPWPRVERDLQRALAGRFALAARVHERSRQYAARHHAQLAKRLAVADVRFENGASDRATIIDVHAPDGEGVLYRITRALGEMDLDIRSAHVQTLGHQVADAFYVVDRAGDKITDPASLAEIERAILDALDS